MTQRRRYAIEMLDKLVEQQEQVLARTYGSIARDNVREVIRFLTELRNRIEGDTR